MSMWNITLGVLMLCLCGCYAIDSEKKVHGQYLLVSGDVKILLDVAADHTYSETVEFTRAPEQRISGTWHWTEGKVCLNAFLVPQMLMRGLLQSVPPEQRPKAVGLSYQLDQCAGAEREYGKTILEINPDSSENFVMVKASPAN
jgi:hypothetical protein